MKVEVEYQQMDDKGFDEFTTLLASIVANYLEVKGLAEKFTPLEKAQLLPNFLTGFTGGDSHGKEKLHKVHPEDNQEGTSGGR